MTGKITSTQNTRTLPVDGTQWHRVFDEALRTSKIGSVAVTVARYLDREPIRSERHASCRAANTYALNSKVQLDPVPIVGKTTPGASQLGANLGDGEHLADIAISRAAPPRLWGWVLDESQIVESITAAVVKAGRAARHFDTDRLDAERAPALVMDLDQTLYDLDADLMASWLLPDVFCVSAVNRPLITRLYA